MKICTYKKSNKYLNQITLEETLSYFFTVDLYREWKIWSKCLGKVVVINGVSSSGKSTLSQYLSNFGFNVISLDTIRDNLLLDYANKHFEKSIFQMKEFLTDSEILKVLFGFKIAEIQHDTHKIEFIQGFQKKFFNLVVQDNDFLTTIKIFDQMYNVAQKFIFSGQNVLLDVMAYGEEINMLHYSFRYYPIKIGLLYSPLEENLTKCFQRNYLSSKNGMIEYRNPIDIMSQYREFYQFVNKDNIYKYNVFEKVEKGTVKNILEIAIHCQLRLLNDFKCYLIADDAVCFLDYDNKIKKLYDLVEILKNSMMLEEFEEVFVVPNVEYDFIVRTSDLQMMNRKFVSSINLGNKEIIIEDILKFCHYKSNSKEMDSGDAMVLYSTVTPVVEKLSNMRFVIYSQEMLPTIIGNNGPIIEFEYDDGLKILGDNYNFDLV